MPLTYEDIHALITEDNESGVDPFSVIESELGITEEAFETLQQGNVESFNYLVAIVGPEEALRGVAFSALRLGYALAQKKVAS